MEERRSGLRTFQVVNLQTFVFCDSAQVLLAVPAWWDDGLHSSPSGANRGSMWSGNRTSNIWMKWCFEMTAQNEPDQVIDQTVLFSNDIQFCTEKACKDKCAIATSRAGCCGRNCGSLSLLGPCLSALVSYFKFFLINPEAKDASLLLVIFICFFVAFISWFLGQH